MTPPGLNIDGGSRWINDFFALSPTRAWLVSGGVEKGAQAIEMTGDSGRKWSKVGVLPMTSCSLKFVSATDGTCTLIGAAAGSEAIKIYRTTNGGRSWRFVFSNFAQTAEPSVTVPVGSIPFGCDKGVQFETSTTGYVSFWCAGGTGAFIYRTSNGGSTWAEEHVAQPTPIPTGGGGFTGPPIFHGKLGAIPYGGGSYSAVFVTDNDGQSFRPVYPPGKRKAWAVDLVTPSQWRLTHGKEIVGTNNAGVSWFTVNSATVLNSATYAKVAPPGGLVQFTSTNDGWLTENLYDPNSTILRTTDGGRSWRKISVPGTKKL